jgi:hypothetical protein
VQKRAIVPALAGRDDRRIVELPRWVPVFRLLRRWPVEYTDPIDRALGAYDQAD